MAEREQIRKQAPARTEEVVEETAPSGTRFTVTVSSSPRTGAEHIE